jgi:hypothetical protein
VTNAVLNPWLQKELSLIINTLPKASSPISSEMNRQLWDSWREGLKVKFTLPAQLPPLRMLLVWDQGKRILTTQDLEQIVFIPTRSQPFILDAKLCSGLLGEQVESNMTDNRQIFGCMVFTNPTTIFKKR